MRRCGCRSTDCGSSARIAIPARCRRGLEAVERAARGTENLLPPMKEALRARATLGEVSDVLRGVYGEYRPSF